MRLLILGGDGFCGWPTALHLSARGHEVAIVDNGSRRRIDAEPGFAAWGTYHYRGGDILTWHGFAWLIFEQAARYGYAAPRITPVDTAGFASKAKRPAYSVLSTEKLTATFGIEPSPLRDSLNECLDVLLGQKVH